MEDVLESDWVFVEEVDIAEEAFVLNPSKQELSEESQRYTLQKYEKSFKHITNLCSDSNSEDDLNRHLENQNAESDVESDGISIISNWSSSQGSPGAENLDDDGDNKHNDNEDGQSGLDDQYRTEEDNGDYHFDQKFKEKLGFLKNIEVVEKCEDLYRKEVNILLNYSLLGIIT